MARSRKNQTRLTFPQFPSSSFDAKSKVHSSSRERRQLREEKPPIPTPEPSSQTVPETFDNGTESDDLYQGASLLKPPLNTSTRSRRAQQTTLTPRRSGRIGTYENTASTAHLSRSRQKRTVDTPSPTPARSAQDYTATKSPSSPRLPTPINNDIYELGSPEDSDEDDIHITTKPAAKRRRLGKSPVEKDSFVVADDDNSDISDSSDSEMPVTPSKPSDRNAPKLLRSRRLKSRREHQEMLEDLDDLQDSDSDRLQSSRTRGALVNKERDRQKLALERLKRRRAGEKEPIQISSDDEESEGNGGIEGYQMKQEYPLFSQNNYAESQDSPLEEETTQNHLLDENEDDFVVPDEEEANANLLGRPHPGVPIEFTSFASAKPRDLFGFVIEWLVKNKIAPAFSRHDPLWKLAFGKVKDEMTAQAGSRLKSSAWTAQFTTVLNGRPGLSTRPLDPGENEFQSCDACNRTGHPAQYEFIFSGSAYQHESLEPVDIDSEEISVDDDDDDHASYDSKGHALPPASKRYFLGRYCAANAELAHKFTHWKYTLNESLIEYLDAQGVLSATAIVARERAKGGLKRREKEAEEIVDFMKAEGEIERLWKTFKEDLQDARVGMEGFQRSGRRGRKRIGAVRVQLAGADELDFAFEDGSGEREEKDFEESKPEHANSPRLNGFGDDSEGE